MGNDFLKGNFEVKKPVKEDEQAKDKSKTTQEEFRQAALNSIGGSMVYVERTDLTWNGEEEESEEDAKK